MASTNDIELAFAELLRQYPHRACVKEFTITRPRLLIGEWLEQPKEQPPMPITPSVGRKVWYYENDTQIEPWDATVVKVHLTFGAAHANSPVNLVVFDPESGRSWFVPGVQVSEGPIPFPHYRWMPYQTAQAERYGSGNIAAEQIKAACDYSRDPRNR